MSTAPPTSSYFDDPIRVKANGRRDPLQRHRHRHPQPACRCGWRVDGTIFQTKLVVLSYVIAGALLEEQHSTLFWDTADPYQYLRVNPHSDHDDLVILGGEDHKTGQVSDTNE